MSKITKLSLYLNEQQYHKLCLLAEQKAVNPEHIANEAIYSYLAIVEPFAVDYDELVSAQRAEADQKYEEWCRLEGLEP